jgi:hypothetical protein
MLFFADEVCYGIPTSLQFKNMDSLKKALRMMVLICLIILATVGVGISGGVPLRAQGKKEEEQYEAKIALVEKEQAPEIFKAYKT